MDFQRTGKFEEGGDASDVAAVDFDESRRVGADAAVDGQSLGLCPSGGTCEPLLLITTRIPSAYGPNYQRLVALKSVWDPDNLFRSSYDILPE